MSKVRKTILSITVAACLLGVGLILVGLASGGLQDLVRSSAASTKMAKQEETYGNIHSLNLDLSNRSVVIEESPDDKVHLTYYQGDGKTTEKISTKAENGSLYIKESSFFININSGLRSLLGLINGDLERTQQITLSLPKGRNLEQVKASLANGSLSINDLTIKKLKADLSNGSIELSHSQIETGSIENDNGSIELVQTSLTDTQISLSNGSITSDKLTLKGNINMSSDNGSIDLHLTEETFKAISLDLQTDLGDIELPKDMQTSHDQDNFIGDRVIHTNEQAQAKLTARTSTGSIAISH
ncbi:DUF4097 domain-containing protein [Streptococcus cristatus]|jgi:hypothetical protein|uniref:DUF4097 family beta strand repeat-containing protein n=1 Tax=Streptococcus cristatus TaxID=45634 RepID=UPI001652CAF0|nr:DUF4097 family beta strand repeat-containing protein [Streptococcus cristatus]MBC6976653.1 DUF4097 domain-containing protein [Streptococcus cristatus]